MKPRLILDTNILISYLLKPNAGMSQLVDTALGGGRVLVSQDTFDELQNVLLRFVARGFVHAQESSEFLAAIVEVAEWVKILEHVRACRDSKDDKFLELAVNGQAAYLITGDKDLLALHPFRETNILSPRDFLDAFLSKEY